MIAAIRIIVLFVKLRKRNKEITKDEAEDRIIFHEEIDDLCLLDEIKKSIAIILGMFVFPLSWVEVWLCSYAGDVSKTVSVISIFIGYYLIIREIENRQA